MVELLRQFQRYVTELDDEPFIQFFEQEMAQMTPAETAAQLDVETVFQQAFDHFIDEMIEDLLLNRVHDWLKEILAAPYRQSSVWSSCSKVLTCLNSRFTCL